MYKNLTGILLLTGLCCGMMPAKRAALTKLVRMVLRNAEQGTPASSGN